MDLLSEREQAHRIASIVKSTERLDYSFFWAAPELED